MRLRLNTNFALLLLLIILLASAQWFHHASMTDLLLNALHKKEIDKVKNIAHALDNLLKSEIIRIQNTAKLLASEDQISRELLASNTSTPNTETLHATLDRWFLHAKVDALSLIDASKTILYRAHDPKQFGDKSTGKGVTEALMGKGILSIESTMDGLTVSAIEPLHNEEAIVGLISTGLRLDEKFFHRLKEQLKADLILIPRTGNLASTPPSLITHLDKNSVEEAFRHKIPVFQETPDKQKTRVFLPLHIIDETFVILIQIDSVSSYQMLDSILKRSAANGLIILIICLLIGALILRYLLMPLRRLRKQAEEIALEITGEEITTAKSDEITTVVQVLDTLTNRLIRRNLQLEAAERRNKATLGAIPDTLILINRQGLVSDISIGHKIHPLLSKERLLGQNFIQLLPNAEGHILAQTISRVHEGAETLSVDFSLYDGKGEYRYEARVSAFGSNEILILIRDVSGDARMLKALAVFNASSQGIMTTDAKGLITSVNPAFSNITGYTADEVVGKKSSILNSGQHDANFFAHLWQTLKYKGEWEGEIWNRRKNGENYPQWLSISTIRDAQGEIIEYVSLFSDFTGRKEQESHLRRQADADREQARVKSEFLTNMSHEIRTPLNAILGFAQAGVRNNVGRQCQTNFLRIQNSGEVLLGIVNEILDFSKLDAGKLILEKATVNLPALLERIDDIITDKAHSKGLRFLIEEGPGLPESFTGDSLRLTQVLLNLLANAIKFTETGQVQLSIDANDGLLEIRVIDTGIGMTDTQVGRIFQPFAQADSSITRRYGGTGLGLAISHRLVALMHGTLSIRSAEHQGTDCTVYLPLEGAQGKLTPKAARLKIPPPAPNNGLQRLQGLCILAVDDSETNQMVLDELLRPEGCTLLQLDSGIAALEFLRAPQKQTINLVLMDIQMPEMDGYEATRLIHTILPYLPVIGLSAHVLEEERQHCIAAGMAGFVAKPIDVETLIKTILNIVVSEVTPSTETSLIENNASQTLIDQDALLGRYQGRTAFIVKLIEMALVEFKTTPQSLRQAALSRNMTDCVPLAHKLKSLGGNFAAASFQELALQTEKSARNNESVAIEQTFRLADTLERFLVELSNLQTSLSS